jgi:hypothetical protein
LQKNTNSVGRRRTTQNKNDFFFHLGLQVLDGAVWRQSHAEGAPTIDPHFDHHGAAGNTACALGGRLCAVLWPRKYFIYLNSK